MSKIVTGQANVTSSITAIVANSYGRVDVTIQNHGNTVVWLGNSSVTTSNGFRLPGVDGASVTLIGGSAIYGVTASGGQVVSTAETF